jgi:hypothetical protein
MSPDVIAAGVFGIAGAVVGAVVGLFGERWVRRWGDVRCVMKDDDWYVPDGAYPPGSGIPRERRLRVTFLNGKELPATVLGLRVEFYKGGELLEEWARPRVQLVEEGGNTSEISELRPVSLPPHIPVPLEIRVISLGPHDTDEQNTARLRALEEADRAKFVATLIGAPDEPKELELYPPWRDE